jgi:hypothetical protein
VSTFDCIAMGALLAYGATTLLLVLVGMRTHRIDELPPRTDEEDRQGHQKSEVDQAPGEPRGLLN